MYQRFVYITVENGAIAKKHDLNFYCGCQMRARVLRRPGEADDNSRKFQHSLWPIAVPADD